MNVKISFKLSTTQVGSLENGASRVYIGARTNSVAARGNLVSAIRTRGLNSLANPEKLSTRPLDMKLVGMDQHPPNFFFNFILYYLFLQRYLIIQRIAQSPRVLLFSSRETISVTKLFRAMFVSSSTKQ